MTVSKEVIRALQIYDSATVSNVIEAFDVRPRSAGYVDSKIRALFPELPPIVGFASTATYRSARPAAKGETHSNLAAQVEALTALPEPRIVIFEHLDEPGGGAVFGEVMCSTYRRFGCIGLITNGPGRDLEAIRKLGFAAFASSCCVSHGYGRIEDIHQPVHVGGVTVRPGDLIHADANGVVVVPVEIARDVAAACPLWIEAERIVLDYLKNEQVTVDGLRQALGELATKLKSIPGTVKETGIELV